MGRHLSSMVILGWDDRLADPDLVQMEFLGRRYIKVTRAIQPAAREMEARLIATGYENPTDYTGSYNKRYIKGTTTWSSHAYGVAIDLDYGGGTDPAPDRNPHLHRPVQPEDFGVNCQLLEHQVRAVEAIRTNNGKQVWRWLGWSIGDTMHFQITCSPEDLATGIAQEVDVAHLGVLFGEEFWREAVALGLIVGDPLYYSSGAATPAEVSHAMAVMLQKLYDKSGTVDTKARQSAAAAQARADTAHQRLDAAKEAL